MRYIFSFAFVLCAFLAKSQDLHFSLADYSPLTLNAGETGLFDGDWRVTGNYRQQWKSIGQPFQTIAAAYDQQIYALPGQFSAGLVVVNDQSGAIDLINNRVYLSMAYAHNTPLWTFSAGIQPGFVIKSYNLNGTSFPEQYNDNIGIYDPSLPLSESNLSNQTNYFDLNAGLAAERKLKSGSIKAGFSVQHLNAPNVSFFDNKDQLAQRFNSYVKWNHDFKSDVFIRTMVLVSTLQKAQELVFGGDVGLYVSDSPNGVKEISLGMDLRNGFNRNADAYILSLGVVISDFRAALAYDVNYSNLNQATNNRGAIEFSLIYISPSTAIKHITIPCDRY
ncbi:type IX secretion system membrane protein PorP/SprF [Cryomorpha ignava]|uniref:Type IX secretion system membrane protein PorP/SprF n=1 Tax=Cryomorpha ignava TaxID=101383 RepID=A0A7K3WNE9_9FLAO|nr:PorP/SprF family type IX secretion system membrane protein [Cryomorpha ignava]NEN23058.1 type IX secretion system membrane protein PorP/SprF [Cryomorpha ignava]